MTPTADSTSHLDDLGAPELNSRRAAILEAQVLVDDWREEYDTIVPTRRWACSHPVEFAERWRTNQLQFT